MLFVTKERTGKSFKARFYVNDWDEAQNAFDYPVDLISILSPGVLGIAEFRTEEDIKVVLKIRGGHRLLRGHGFRFSTEFHETNDKDLFAKNQAGSAKQLLV